jgi:hypothetical protein
MTTDPRTTVERAARELLGTLADLPDPPRLRVTDSAGRVACTIVVWATGGAGPRPRGRRAGCRAAVLAVLRVAGRAMTHGQLLEALRDAGTPHSPATVMRALADLTRAGEVVNPKDRRGYRLASWPLPGTPPLF